MSNKEKNVTLVRDEDKNFIRALTELSPEKKILVKGILIGLDLQKEPAPASTTHRILGRPR